MQYPVITSTLNRPLYPLRCLSPFANLPLGTGSKSALQLGWCYQTSKFILFLPPEGGGRRGEGIEQEELHTWVNVQRVCINLG
eukprot:853548-Amorphochlora_amoeboformis.AAC.1